MSGKELKVKLKYRKVKSNSIYSGSTAQKWVLPGTSRHEVTRKTDMRRIDCKFVFEVIPRSPCQLKKQQSWQEKDDLFFSRERNWTKLRVVNIHFPYQKQGIRGMCIILDVETIPSLLALASRQWTARPSPSMKGTEEHSLGNLTSQRTKRGDCEIKGSSPKLPTQITLQWSS